MMQFDSHIDLKTENAHIVLVHSEMWKLVEYFIYKHSQITGNLPTENKTTHKADGQKWSDQVLRYTWHSTIVYHSKSLEI